MAARPHSDVLIRRGRLRGLRGRVATAQKQTAALAENPTVSAITVGPSGCPVPPPRARWGALLRVSDSSRQKFQTTLANDID